jgi:YVTN family beta-propeller protein
MKLLPHSLFRKQDLARWPEWRRWWRCRRRAPILLPTSMARALSTESSRKSHFPDQIDGILSTIAQRIYVAQGDRVTVVDEPTGTIIGQVGHLPGITHGVAISPQTHQGFTDEGRPGLAIAFNLKTLKLTKQIETAPDADGLLFDPATDHIYVVNGDSGTITVIDPSSDAKIATIDVGSKLEPAVSDGAGKIYVNGEQKNEIIEINTYTNKILARWPMATCRTPHGIAIDTTSRRIFSTCANKVLVVVNADTGATVATLPIGEHSDGAAFDPVRKLVLSSNWDGTLTVIKELSPNHFNVFETVKTQRSARTISIDPKTGRLFLIAADIKSEKPAAKLGGRPHVIYKPNSVKLLYLEPSF